MRVSVYSPPMDHAQQPPRADHKHIQAMLATHGIQPTAQRIRIAEMMQVRPYLTARIAQVPELSPPAGDLETEALARNAANLFRQVVELSPMLPDELATVAQNVTQPDRLGDLIAATLPVLTTQVKQELLETPDVKARLARLVSPRALGDTSMQALNLGP